MAFAPISSSSPCSSLFSPFFSLFRGDSSFDNPPNIICFQMVGQKAQLRAEQELNREIIRLSREIILPDQGQNREITGARAVQAGSGAVPPQLAAEMWRLRRSRHFSTAAHTGLEALETNARRMGRARRAIRTSGSLDHSCRASARRAGKGSPRRERQGRGSHAPTCRRRPVSMRPRIRPAPTRRAHAAAPPATRRC